MIETTLNKPRKARQHEGSDFSYIMERTSSDKRTVYGIDNQLLFVPHTRWIRNFEQEGWETIGMVKKEVLSRENFIFWDCCNDANTYHWIFHQISIPIFTIGSASSRNHSLEDETFHVLKELAREKSLNFQALLRNQEALNAVADSEYTTLDLYRFQAELRERPEYQGGGIPIFTELFLVSPEDGELTFDKENGIVFEGTGKPIETYEKDTHPEESITRNIREDSKKRSLTKLTSLNITRKYALSQEPRRGDAYGIKLVRPSLRLVEPGDFSSWFDVPFPDEDATR